MEKMRKTRLFKLGSLLGLNSTMCQNSMEICKKYKLSQLLKYVASIKKKMYALIDCNNFFPCEWLFLSDLYVFLRIIKCYFLTISIAFAHTCVQVCYDILRIKIKSLSSEAGLRFESCPGRQL